MFKKKRKTVLEVLRQCNDIKLSNEVIFKLFQKYENNKCEKATIEEIQTYNVLCEHFFASDFSEYGRCIIQETYVIVDAAHPTNPDRIPACYRMNPTKEALVFLMRNYEGLVRIFKYVPHPSENPVWLGSLDYLRPNFDLYDVYKPAERTSLQPGSLVKDFNELTVSSSIIAFSKEQLTYESNGKQCSFPIILRH